MDEKTDNSVPSVPPPEVGEYKGHPTISLFLTGGDRPTRFTFGKAKALAIIRCFPEIEAFVEGE